MNYKKLYEWASKIQMNGKPSLNYIFRDADGTFSAVNESMGFNVPSLPEGIPFREETPFYLASKLKRNADLYDYTICDAPHLYCIKIKECKTGEVSGKTIPYVMVDNSMYNARHVKQAIDIMGKNVHFCKGANWLSPLFVVEDETSWTVQCMIMPIRYDKNKIEEES